MHDRNLVMTDADLQELDEQSCAVPGRNFARYPRSMCTHSQWSWKRWGRVCPSCGTFIVDFGD